MASETNTINTPHISILLPLYNGIEFLHQSVASVFHQQSTIPWELIIGVNGHPPNSDVFHVANKVVADLRMQLMTQTNGASATFVVRVLDLSVSAVDGTDRQLQPPPRGKSAALNAMVAAMHPMSQWVALLDADDIWLPNKLAIQMPYTWPTVFITGQGQRIKRAAYDIIGTHCDYFGTRRGSPAIPTGDISSADFFKVNPIINSSALVRKELAYWKSQHDGVEDYDLWLTLWKAGKRFYNCPEKAVMHRIHEASAFNSNGKNNGLVEGLLRQHR